MDVDASVQGKIEHILGKNLAERDHDPDVERA
jgi:hypothetical protein